MMITQPVTLSVDMTNPALIDTLLDHHLSAAPVVDMQGRLVGVLSSHDVMVDLLCQDYLLSQDQKW